MIRDLIGSQFSCLRIGVILSHFTRRAAEFWTFCRDFTWQSSMPYRSPLFMSSQDRTPAVETVSLWTVSWCRPASVLTTWGLCISASGLSILLSKWVGQPSSPTDRLTSWSPLHSRLSAVCARHMRTRDSCWRLWGQLSPLPSASARIPSVATTRMRRVADTTSEISFSEWQRVKCGDGKQRTKIVVCKLPADDFLQKVTRVVEDFRDHAGRVNTTSRRDTGRDLVMALGELSSVVRLKQPNKIDSL